MKEDALLETIRCSRETIPAGVDPHLIEQHAQDAKVLWMRQENIEHPEAVERICALYLFPETQSTGFEEMLSKP